MEEPGELAVQELEVPELGPKDSLVRVELSGICGSDVHMYDGGMDLDFPVVPGHEFAGVIEDVGEEVETDANGDHLYEELPDTVRKVVNMTEIKLNSEGEVS